jgi:integrase/recombinase XerD
MRTRSGKRLIRQGAFQIVNNLYRHAGIKKEGLHLLRHTFAMWMTLRGVNVIDIKDAMRHSNINTTMVYAKATKQSVMNAVVG